MTGTVDIQRLIELLRAALTEADLQENTLVAALLTECIEAIKV